MEIKGARKHTLHGSALPRRLHFSLILLQHIAIASGKAGFPSALCSSPSFHSSTVLKFRVFVLVAHSPFPPSQKQGMKMKDSERQSSAMYLARGGPAALCGNWPSSMRNF